MVKQNYLNLKNKVQMILNKIMKEEWKNYKMIKKNYKLKELEYGEKKLIVNNNLKNLWNGKK